MRRTADAIFDKGGFIRQVDNLGFRNLPYKVSVHGLVHRTGNAFVVKFDVPPTALQDLVEEYGRDVDIVKRHIFKDEQPSRFACTLHEEMMPPAYRKEVIKMMSIAKKKQKEKYPMNTGLSYYPFQK